MGAIYIDTQELKNRLTKPHSKEKLQYPTALRKYFEAECGFTNEELYVLQLRAKGLSVIQIADEIPCSPETVQRKIRIIKNKIAAIL